MMFAGYGRAAVANWSGWHTIFVVVVVPVVLGVVALSVSPLAAWLIGMVVILITLAVIGEAINGVKRGILVDERNKVSLSRFQTVLWTTLVLSGYIVMVAQNSRADAADPALVTFPPELLWLLGISATSLVGSPLVRSTLERRTPNLGAVALPTNRRGIIMVNPAPATSSWADMFKGEEIVNEKMVDLGKVQMFFFTLVAVASYAILLGKLLATDAPFAGFPDLSEGIVGLLGISHAAYLTNKSVARTKTT